MEREKTLWYWNGIGIIGMNSWFLIRIDIEFYIDVNVDSLGLSTDRPESSATAWLLAYLAAWSYPVLR